MLAGRRLRRRVSTPRRTSATLSCSAKHGVRWTTDAPLVLDPNNQAIVYVGGEVIDRSTNRGQGGFTQISPGGRRTTCPGPIPPEEQDTGLYANLYGAVTAIGLAKDALPGSTAPNNYAQTIYAGTDTGLLWKTSDAGATLDEAHAAGRLPDAVGERHRGRPGRRRTRVRHLLRLPRGRQRREHLGDQRTAARSGRTSAATCPNAPLDAVVLDPTDGIVIVSGDLGVFFLRKPADNPKSTTWTRLGTNLPNTSVQDIKIQASTHTLYAMTFGRGVQAIPLPPQYPFAGFRRRPRTRRR